MNEQEPVNTVLSWEHFLTSYVNKAIGHHGITAHTWLHSRGITATFIPITAGKPAIPITVQLSNAHLAFSIKSSLRFLIIPQTITRLFFEMSAIHFALITIL